MSHVIPMVLSDPVAPHRAEPGASTTFTAAEEVALARRIDAGLAAAAALDGALRAPAGARAAELRAVVADGARARMEFTCGNLPLVWWVVTPIARAAQLEPRELFQEGAIGLLEAIRGFDPQRGRFTTYAVPRIRMRTWDVAITGHGSVGLPARRAREWRRTRWAAADLAGVLARTPRADEVAAAMGETPGAVRTLLSYGPPVVLPPEASVWEEHDTGHTQCTASDEVDRVEVRRLLRRLGDADRQMVCWLFGLDGPMRTHAEIARELGLSVSTIRRRERRALDLLRAGTEALAA